MPFYAVLSFSFRIHVIVPVVHAARSGVRLPVSAHGPAGRQVEQTHDQLRLLLQVTATWVHNANPQYDIVVSIKWIYNRGLPLNT